MIFVKIYIVKKKKKKNILITYLGKFQRSAENYAIFIYRYIYVYIK